MEHKLTQLKLIKINFPPKYDGELHIKVETLQDAYAYTFIHAATGDEWKTLVTAAKAIIAQDKRLINHKSK